MRNIQELGLSAIVVTVCLSFFASVILSALGRPVSPELQGVINTTFTAFAVVVPVWLQANRTEKQKQEAFEAGLKQYDNLTVRK
jgi:Kef-type K+ transport system membrane component KefB